MWYTAAAVAGANRYSPDMPRNTSIRSNWNRCINKQTSHDAHFVAMMAMAITLCKFSGEQNTCSLDYFVKHYSTLRVGTERVHANFAQYIVLFWAFWHRLNITYLVGAP